MTTEDPPITRGRPPGPSLASEAVAILERNRTGPVSYTHLFINGTTIEIDGGMLPGVLYEAGLKTIEDLL